MRSFRFSLIDLFVLRAFIGRRLSRQRRPPHRYVVGAACVEAVTVPVGPAVLEAHPTQASHEVQFARPGVAVHEGKGPRAPGSVDNDLRGRQQLLGRIVILYDQPGETAAQAPGLQAQRIAPWRIGNPSLNDEPPSGSQMPGCILEAFDLALLGAHGVNRVDQEHDEVELALGGGGTQNLHTGS